MGKRYKSVPLTLAKLIAKVADPDWRKVLRRDPCVYCGRRFRNASRRRYWMSLDHIDPKSRGGRNAKFLNLAPACRSCNEAKGDANLLGFLVAGGMRA